MERRAGSLRQLSFLFYELFEKGGVFFQTTKVWHSIDVYCCVM